MADVQKSAFSLSSATIMMANAFDGTDDVFSLRPDKHSVGMVSEVAVNLDSSVTELLNGVSQTTVDAKRTGVKANISGNVFEYTTANLLRAQSLSTAPQVIKRGVLTADAAGGAVSLSIKSDPIPGETGSAITALTDIPAGSTLLIQRVNGEQDYVFPTKTSGAATGTADAYTVPIAAPYALPQALSFAAGARVWVLQPVPFGNIDADSFFAVKITGTLSAYDRPVTFIAPKVRVTQGFQISFNETQYGSMPWQMQPLLLTRGEVQSNPRFADIGTRQPGLLYVGG